MTNKNPHAVALGSLGGSRHTEAQQAAARKPKAGAGRPAVWKHVPAPGRCEGLRGPALCRRDARYLTADHVLIRRLALEAIASGETRHYCPSCLARLAKIADLQPREKRQ